jgi:phenylacetate-coenzyme A ligase PaaK-like adenylate-forming protein
VAELEQLRAAHMARALEMAPEFCSRLRWTPQQLAGHQRRALRELLAVAVDRSPWHRKRLKGIDLGAVDPSDLTALPVMTKAELMADWDDIVTEGRLRLADVDAHLEHGDGGYLFDEYTAMATGGSTGQRGVIVYDRDGLATLWLSGARRLPIERHTTPAPCAGPLSIGYVMAAHPSHLSGAFARTFHDPRVVSVNCPVTWSVDRIVATLNDAQPVALAGYPSALALLAREAAVGRLHIRPATVVSVGEPLLPEVRTAAEATWGRPVINAWGSTESGILGSSCPSGAVHLSPDIGIVEVVDAEGRPVPDGVTGAKIYVTNLFNHVLPTIRYEISDEVTVLPERCPCGEASRIVGDVQGRRDDIFVYDGRAVHPHVFRSAFTRRAAIPEYQVRQTAQGADVDVCCGGELDSAALAAELTESLRQIGLPEPRVTIRRVDRISRASESGKLKRFVPLVAS